MNNMAEVSAALPKIRIYSCCSCKTHIAFHNHIIPGDFVGRLGRAFLLCHAINIRVAKSQRRQLMTGVYTVADVFCKDCNSMLGWKYLKAEEDSEKYKEGKFVLETLKVAEVED
ncbi:protein yippee-like At4g27745 [Andrographis paniculata]|uniref:protein yippee-like At4g27745 n=1 Tax=Andrographis paniculata TaxID=175694 RepID=UPI0021E7B2D6|nr:protein yippee-like At4g27745 [Andrographis paniculata]